MIPAMKKLTTKSSTVSVREAAQILGVTRARVYQLVANETLRDVSQHGLSIRLSRAAVQQYKLALAEKNA